MSVESYPTKARFYLLTMVLQIDSGLAYGGFEWHEKYVAKIPAELSNEALLNALMAVNRSLSSAVLIKTGSGHRLKLGNCLIFATRTELRPTTAKELLEQKVLPLLNFQHKVEVAL
jgi:hypothetical protein